MTQFISLMKELNSNKESRIRGALGAYTVGPTMLSPGDAASFNKPTEILVSRWYPGYRVADLTGPGADEAVGVLLATSLSNDESLDSFRTLLATPDVAIRITLGLLPRAGVPVKRGKGYLVSEARIGKVVAEELSRYDSGPAVTAAITHVFVRIFNHMKIVQPGLDERTINVSEGFAIRARELRRYIMIEGMRDMFTDQRIATATRELNEDATPDLIGETIGRMLRETARLIPEVKLRLEQLNIAMQLVNAFHLAPSSLTKKMQASTALQSLAGYANFLENSAGGMALELPLYANDDMIDAVNNILQVISSAPSMEPMPLSKFVSLFGFTPAVSSEGLYRGAVAYMPLGQTSKMDVADHLPRPDGCEMALVPAEYVHISQIAGELTRTLASAEAMTGVANIVADELVQSVADLGDPPMLYTIGVSDTDLIYLAIGMSEVTLMVREGSGPGRLVFGVRVNDKWLMRVQAATPAIAYFDDPAAAVAYKVPESPVPPSPLPARPQTVGLSPSVDQVFRGDCSRWTVEDIERPFNFSLPLRNPSEVDGVTELRLTTVPLFGLVNTDGSVPDRLDAHYVAIREPGVDRDLELVLSIAHLYSSGSNVDLADTAKSWIIENSYTLVTHPAIQREATRALNQAIREAKLDGRKLATQFKSVTIKAYFGTLTGTLARFGKIPTGLASNLMNDVPVDGLTVRSRIALASIPTTLNATQLLNK